MVGTSLGGLVESVWRGAKEGRLDAAKLQSLPDYEAGERVQLGVLERWQKAGDERAGWKVGLTSGEARDSFGPGVRPFGFLLRSRVHQSGARIERASISDPGIETELCFRIGKRLRGPNVDSGEAARGVAAVMPAFEINEDRIKGTPDQGLRVADNLRQWGIVIGEEVAPVPADLDWDGIVSTLSVDGKLVQTVPARGHIDSHFRSIAALANELAKHGRALEPGDVCITGSFTRMRITAPGRYEGAFSGLGTVAVEFA